MLKPQLVEFMRRMDPRSVAIIPAAREAVRSHDTNYRYRQNSDFFYLTGFEEPEAIAVIAPSEAKKFTLFVRPRDPERAIWDGYRAGVEGAKADYSADEALKTARAGMKEYEIEALLEASFRRQGAAGSSYTSIVGSGANATTLHYITNQDTLRDGDLLLVDAGAEYLGYASDITRTFPIDGQFTEAQRDIYDLVLKTQMSCIDMVRPGVRLEDLKTHSVEMLTEGMVKLGLLKGDPAKLIEEKKYMQFYMHNLGHFLGIDVHDAGRY